jgi:transcriptional regulator with XRE-family HTH domain
VGIIINNYLLVEKRWAKNMEQQNLGKQVREARMNNGLTQEELAFKCNLDIRTIQRIESGRVKPRDYTIRIISKALNMELKKNIDDNFLNAELEKYRKSFAVRKKYRIITFIAAIVLMISVVILAFPTWVLWGMPKHVWAPYFYLIMFAHLIGIGLTWRCPACNALLGDVFNTRYCSKCGLKFYS